MTDEIDAFHAAIYANPDDPLPRLVYADWLDDHGEAEYAELIRLFAEAGNRPHEHFRGGPLRRRQAELYRAVYAQWGLADLLPGRTWRVKFVNGVAADELEVTVEELSSAAGWPRFLRPRRLGVGFLVGEESSLAGCGYLNRVTELAARLQIDSRYHLLDVPADPLLGELSDCPYLRALIALQIDGVTPTPESLRRFAAAPLTGRLVRFDLWHPMNGYEVDQTGHRWPAHRHIAAESPPAEAVRAALIAASQS